MTPFPPWMPDIARFSTAASSEALNVIPSPTGFRPFPSFASVTSALPARAQGAITVRSSSGGIFTFVGDATKLYRLATTGLSWTDVSRTAGGAYATPTDSNWSFAQYGDYVIACNAANETQVFQLGVSSNFANLAGSAPQAFFAGAIKDFAILARESTAYNRIRWSAINNHASWVPSATTLSDYQDFPDGGQIMGFVGGQVGVVFQERAINRMMFEGPPTAFRFDKISNFLGCRVERSIAAYDNMIFFLSDDGFYMISGGSELVPIGVDKVDDWLESNMNDSLLYRVSASVDPVNKLYIMGFVSINAPDQTPDSLVMFHWPTGQWSRAQVSHQLIYTAAVQASYTIDGMDAVSSTIDGLPYPVDSRFWAGSGKLLLGAFDGTGKQGFFSGLPLAATLETGDIQLSEGRRSMFRALRPLVEGTSATVSLTVGTRNSLTEPVTYGSAVSANSYGICNARANARYHRARIGIAAGGAWSLARGVDDLKFSTMGER